MMINNLVTVMGRVARVLLALACAVAWLPSTATAQSGAPRLTIQACDGQDYPNVTCLVTAIDRNGLPPQALDASAFEVNDASDIVVTENVNSGVSTALLFLVDLSASLRGTTVQAMKDALDAMLDEMAKDETRTNDQVAMIALTKAQLDVGANPNAPPIDPTTEVDFSIDKVLPRNVLRPLSASSATPLYDGIRKALLLTAKQELGRRAIVVFSDGVDTRSSQFTVDSDIDQAQRESIPIFTLKFGQRPDTAKLQRLAIDTGGEQITAGTPQEIASEVLRIQNRLKTQYTISFKSTAATQSSNVTIRWKIPSGTIEQTGVITNLPAPASLTGIQINGSAADLSTTLLKGEVTVTPQLEGSVPTQVEYVLNGASTVVNAAPFAFTFQADDLPETSTLVVNVTSSSGAADSETFTLKREMPVIEVTPEPTPEPTGLETLMANVQRNPVLAAAIAIAAIGLLVLIIIIAILIARRRRTNIPSYPSADYAMPTSVQPNVGATSFQMPSDNPGTVSIGTQVIAAPSAPVDPFGKTQVMSDSDSGKTMVMPNADGGKTRVWQPGKARLEFTSGDRKGETFMVGMPGREIIVGREVKDAEGNIRTKSQFVSRQHASITVEGDQMMLTDLGSSSGTQINGTRLTARTPTPVKVGDEIEFADITAKLIEL